MGRAILINRAPVLDRGVDSGGEKEFVWLASDTTVPPFSRHRLSIAFSAYRRIRLLLRGAGVIHVVTAVITVKENLQ